MSTPGRRKALKAIGARKRQNRKRIKRGESPILQDKKGRNRRVSLATFRKRTGTTKAAIKRIRKKGGK
jgi:hypothetical protein